MSSYPVATVAFLGVALFALAGCPQDPPDTPRETGLVVVSGVCGEARMLYSECGWDENSPGRPTLQEHVDLLLAGSCDEAVECFASCLIESHEEDVCWNCEFSDADCYGDEEIFNPLMDCAKDCPGW